MTDSINSQIDALVVASQPTALRISSDRTQRRHGHHLTAHAGVHVRIQQR